MDIGIFLTYNGQVVQFPVNPEKIEVSSSSNNLNTEIITIGCDVILNGRVQSDSYGSKPGKTFTNYRCKISLINKKGSHAYHVTTPDGSWLGWVTEESVVLA